MPWWMWALLAWCVFAPSIGLVIGKGIKRADGREESDRSAAGVPAPVDECDGADD